jgi:proline iminopeptidase
MFVAAHVALFRATKGAVGASMRGQKVLLLTTTGNKSGKARTVPVMQFDDDGRRYVIGSAGGSPEDPAWIKNLRKTPEVAVEVRGQKYKARAQLLSGEDRKRIWDKVVAVAPGFDEYQKKAPNREIPVVELTPL